MPEQAVQQVLVDVVSQPTVAASRAILEPIAEPSVEPLVHAARAHGLEAWLAACAPLDNPAWQPLAEQRPRFLAERMRTAAVLDDLRSVFVTLSGGWSVLKGPALEYSIYPRPDLRHSVDLDVLVQPAHFREALAALEGAGFLLLDRNWPLVAHLVPGQLRIRSPRGILVDLHWSVLNDPHLRQVFLMPTSALLAGSRTLDPPGIPALSPVEQLVHLGIHGSLSGANRLLWLLDAHLAARRVDDWHGVVVAAQQARADGALALVLARAQRIWRTRVPESVLRTLAGGRLALKADRTIDSLGRLGRDPHLPALSRAWARSTRATSGGTLSEFGKHGLAWLAAGRPRDRAESPITDRTDPRSTLFPVDDPDARASYLDAVSALA